MQVLTESAREPELRQAPPQMAFGEVTVDVGSRRVRAPTGASDLEPKAFDLLLTLVERPGLTASRDHLIETVWARDDGSHAALEQAVVDLRRALGDDARAPRFIETVPQIGYRWIFEAAPSPPPRWSLGSALAVVVGELRSFVDR